MKVYEILVPTMYGDTEKPIKTKHHKQWDVGVNKLVGGLTILSPAKGQWIDGDKVLSEKVIPVRIACELEAMRKVADFTISHYSQKAVMFYEVSPYAEIRSND